VLLGDFMGLGETRKLELLKAASSLGIPGAQSGMLARLAMITSCVVIGFFLPDTQVRIVENEKLLDGMQSWSNLQVSSHIAEFVDSFNIDHVRCRVSRRSLFSPQFPSQLITFDERGVSGHRNHIDTFRGVR